MLILNSMIASDRKVDVTSRKVVGKFVNKYEANIYGRGKRIGMLRHR